MHFTKLSLTGFKSFVERTELEIAPGLTGVVGPNGCGKSNLVEAMRWMMGESSAKQMRGGEMDDVIFGGTTNRPARDLAEVTLHLDNATRTAPAEFNDESELQISRRIQRDRGSNYRINNHEVRAKDVQILFADLATGPRSTAMVSQGRVSALINAKPAGRRLLLEEAAGITGLHTRRHEAELKLNAAETNLDRLEDVVVALATQLDGLKKQARQAKRYRGLSDRLRETEAVVLHRRWQSEEDLVQERQAEFDTADQAVTEKTRLAAAATTEREKSGGTLGPLRNSEAAAAAELQRLTLASEALDAELQRNQDAVTQCDSRLEQISGDHARETTLEHDAQTAIDGLKAAIAEIQALVAQEGASLASAETNMKEANARSEATDAELASLTKSVATAEARRASLIQQIDEITKRLDGLTGQRTTAAQTLANLEVGTVSEDAITSAEDALTDTRQQLESARDGLTAAEKQRIEAEGKTQIAREARQRAQERRGQFAAEAQALRELLGSHANSTQDREPDASTPPALDQMTVSAGFEIALGAALGADLEAPVVEPNTDVGSAPAHHWRHRTATGQTPAPVWPENVEPISRHVRGPQALDLAIANIGVVPDHATGERLAPLLAPGQSLVSRQGDYWRWDGFSSGTEGVSREATLLRQKNRLTDLDEEIAKASHAASLEGEAYQAAETALAKIRETERAARDRNKSADAAHAAAGQRHATILRQAAEQSSKLEGLRTSILRIDEDLTTYGRTREEKQAEVAGHNDLTDQRAELETAQEAATSARTTQRDTRATFDNLDHAVKMRAQRRATMEEEQASWEKRRNGAAERIVELGKRRGELVTEKQALAGKPAAIEEKRTALLDTLGTAEEKRRTAADQLAAAETAARAKDHAAREADALLADVRETRVRAESLCAQALQARQAVAERIAERLQCGPAKVLETVGLDEKKDLPDLETAERRLERVVRERDNMGPVNLRAEQEAEELLEQITTMHTERDDLTAAIDRLRQGISGLNREARQRLLASFADVNTHFQELFKHLFGGGEAHLELTETEDPLQAGLEIYASPPGKKLQALSLLSGGEQALTAMALLFGVFLTNPAPICVLDEVDAPLDDANVDRFCNLLDRIVQRTQTRFILVTHHRMTMSRMDRLYGVTMAERGVSQLVSVDLQQAQELRKTA